MALTIYPTEGYDSFISLADAGVVINENSLSSTEWFALTNTVKEVYLRLATTRILQAIDEDLLVGYDATLSCLPETTAMMAVHDLTYGLSSDINPNLGTITKEKVGDLEVQYKQRDGAKGRVTSIFPSIVIPCLQTYGAKISNGGFYQTALERK